MRIHNLIALALLAFSSSAIAADITGRATVIGGGTIEIHGQRIRLHGIDAPESAQICNRADGSGYRCGKDAASALDKFLAASRPTRCVEMDRDRYRRVVAECFRADGENLNATMVLQGWAVDWVRYSNRRYSGYQALAQATGRGIWSGPFEMPCAYRAAKTGRQTSC